MYSDIPYHVHAPTFTPLLNRLWAVYSSVGRDSFLRVCLLRKIIFFMSQTSDSACAELLLDLPAADLTLQGFYTKKCALMLHQLGMTLMKNGNPSKAKESFLRAARLDPDYPIARAISALKKVKNR